MNVQSISRPQCFSLVLAALLAGLADAQCPTADLTGDCRVDLADYALFASQWLDEGISDPDGMVWIYINAPGVSGKKGFVGKMSKYETTNSQYCQFLNIALVTGDISIVGREIMGANGSNSGEDFIGQSYYNLTGSGYTYDGATDGGASRIKYNGSQFVVDSGYENHPVTYVSWYGASAFCNYYGWRLPKELEWQAVADFDGSYTYGCGTAIDNSRANYLNSVHPHGTTEVGAFGVYGYGLADLAGNVWEWTSSLYSPPSSYRVIRGGGWNDIFNKCAVLKGYHFGNPFAQHNSIGFRVCR